MNKLINESSLLTTLTWLLLILLYPSGALALPAPNHDVSCPTCNPEHCPSLLWTSYLMGQALTPPQLSPTSSSAGFGQPHCQPEPGITHRIFLLGCLLA